jgi:hypothetical protein
MGGQVSFEAINWAFSQPIKHSTAKFVLVAMANHADAQMTCWPSLAHLCAQTAQDRKTVQAGIVRLRELGYIEDTGERKGTTKQVIAYRLKTPVIGPVSSIPGTDEEGATKSSKSTENGPVSGGNNELGNDEKTAPNTSENGPVKEAQIPPCTENETGPFFPLKRPVFPTKEAQISHETGPKTGHGTIKEPSRNHQGTINKKNVAEKFIPLDELLKLGIDAQAAADWLKIRKAKNAPLTQTALNGLIREAGKAGLSVCDAVKLCCERGWQSMRADWLQNGRTQSPRGPASDSQRQADNEEAYRQLFGKKPSEVIDV